MSKSRLTALRSVLALGVSLGVLTLGAEPAAPSECIEGYECWPYCIDRCGGCPTGIGVVCRAQDEEPFYCDSGEIMVSCEFMS
jgi:hypothetical protein